MHHTQRENERLRQRLIEARFRARTAAADGSSLWRLVDKARDRPAGIGKPKASAGIYGSRNTSANRSNNTNTKINDNDKDKPNANNNRKNKSKGNLSGHTTASQALVERR